MSEKLTETRRATLRDRGIFPRSKDFNVLFGVLGGVIGYKSLNFDPGHGYQISEIILLSLMIPLGVAIGSIFATLIQSKFLFRLSFSKEKSEVNLTDVFYLIVKFIIWVVVSGILFRKVLEEASLASLVFSSTLSGTISILIGLLILYGVIGMLVSRFAFIERYQMSKSEIEADAREGEMRPEVKEAMESSFVNKRESD